MGLAAVSNYTGFGSSLYDWRRRHAVRTMSLTSFLEMPDVTAKVKPLRPKLPRKLSVPLKVEPRSKRYMLVGTAFDYLLRFELQRRAPHAISERWVAEYAPKIISGGWVTAKGEVAYVPDNLLREANRASFDLDTGEWRHLPENLLELVDRARLVLDNAKAAVAAYMKLKSPTAVEKAELAGHAIRLAKLDSVLRVRRLEPNFEEASSEDIQDLLDLLAIVPFNELLHGKLFLLNPTFGQASRLVGGADSDLIAGDLLVDFKTTKNGEIENRYLDQILGYLLLARKQRSIDPTFPVINRVGLYYCRHGYLWSVAASTWTFHPGFPGIEQWFFQRADEVFGAAKKPGK